MKGMEAGSLEKLWNDCIPMESYPDEESRISQQKKCVFSPVIDNDFMTHVSYPLLPSHTHQPANPD